MKSFPNTLFRIIGEEGETNYFHMKMLFFAYIFTSIVEYFIKRKSLISHQNFVYTRMLIAVVYPWMTITVFFLSEAITGDMLAMPWEIIYANVITVFGIYVALRLEEALDVIEFRPALAASILTIFFIALFTYVVFTFNTPEHFFVTPVGEFGH